MKKIILFLFIILCSLTFFACSNDSLSNTQQSSGNINSNTSQIDYTNILNDINESLKDSNQNANPLQIKTFSQFGNDISKIISNIDLSVNSWINENTDYEIINIYPTTNFKESTNNTYRADFFYSVTIIYRLK